MGDVTLEQLKEDRETIWQAIMKGARGATRITVLGRVYERPQLSELRELLNEVDKRIARLERGGKRVRRAVPLG